MDQKLEVLLGDRNDPQNQASVVFFLENDRWM